MKFGGGSMGALNIWTQNALKEQVAKREEDRRIDAEIKRAQLQAQLEMDLNEKKYQFDKERGLLEKPRDPIADYRAKMEIEKEFNPPQPVGQPIIEDIGGGLYKITDSVTGKYEIRTKPKAGRGGGGGGGSTGGYTTTGEPSKKPNPGMMWQSSITASGKTSWKQVPIVSSADYDRAYTVYQNMANTIQSQSGKKADGSYNMPRAEAERLAQSRIPEKYQKPLGFYTPQMTMSPQDSLIGGAIAAASTVPTQKPSKPVKYKAASDRDMKDTMAALKKRLGNGDAAVEYMAANGFDPKQAAKFK